MSATAPAHVPAPMPGSTATMLRLDEVEKVYRTDRIETVALSNISLDVASGEFISIMGPSGCGKSTLLHLMGLLDAPTAGRVVLDGEPHWQEPWSLMECGVHSVYIDGTCVHAQMGDVA